MFSILGAAFSWLTGNSKSADKAMSAVDALVYTDQEKTEASDARLDKVLKFKIEYAKHTQNQSIARRVIAFGFTAVFLALCLVVVIAGAFNREVDSYSAFVFKFLKDVLMEPQGYIIMFYFASHVLSKLGQK